MKYFVLSTITLLLLQSHVTNVDSAKILCIFHTMARSHFIVGETIAKGLVDAGHELTVISPFPQKKPIKNWRDIELNGMIEVMAKARDAADGKIRNFLDISKDSHLKRFESFTRIAVLMTNFTLTHEKVQTLLNSNESYDLILMEVFLNEAMLGFGHRFNASVVGFSPFGAMKWTNDMVGTPAPLSYVPHPFLGLTDRMTFLERLGNTVFSLVEHLYWNYFYLPKQRQIYDEIFADPKPELDMARKNVSLILLNNHFSTSSPKPYVPNMIEIGGIQIKRNPGRLPDDLQAVLDNATNGVIYFSMGSNIQSKMLPVKLRAEILTAFAGLKEQVLWKWEDTDLPERPDNVHISKWYPQDEILAHPNVKLFMTHGGLLGSSEAIYHGVPMLGFPVFGDQELNMARAVREGFGLSISYPQLNGALLKEALDTMLATDSFAKRVKLVSEQYRDRPMTPIETAVYWVEYVIRHNGASHLRSAGQDLSFVTYHNLDVLGFLLVVPLIILYILKLLICSVLCRKSSAKAKAKRQIKVKTN